MLSFNEYGAGAGKERGRDAGPTGRRQETRRERKRPLGLTAYTLYDKEARDDKWGHFVSFVSFGSFRSFLLFCDCPLSLTPAGLAHIAGSLAAAGLPLSANLWGCLCFPAPGLSLGKRQERRTANFSLIPVGRNRNRHRSQTLLVLFVSHLCPSCRLCLFATR